jgi:hypothetical protein
VRNVNPYRTKINELNENVIIHGEVKRIDQKRVGALLIIKL